MKKCAKLFMSCAILSGAVFLSAKDIATHRTTGTLTFEVRTTSYDGEYEPDNSGAIWVMNSSNQFVKTLKLWANSRKRHLVKWNDDTNGNEVDAVTGATVSSHRVHTATWDGTDIHGVDAPDGEYNIRVEMTEAACPFLAPCAGRGPAGPRCLADQ